MNTKFTNIIFFDLEVDTKTKKIKELGMVKEYLAKPERKNLKLYRCYTCN